jgi:hypothetical protein
MKASGLSNIVATVTLVSGAACQADRMDVSRFPVNDRVAIRAALDSFRSVNGDPTAVQSIVDRGDTVVVTLLSVHGAADPGKWDGPRLDVSVVRPARIVRAKQIVVD